MATGDGGAPSGGTANDDMTTTGFGGADHDTWRLRRERAAILTAAAWVLPVLAAAGTASLTGRVLGRPEGLGGGVRWWGLVLATSFVALVLVHRATRRLLPLATLYRLELTFPGPAPSRLRVALFGGAARTPTTSPTDTAAHLVALATTLDDHDRRTRGHAERVQAFADLIATDLGLAPDDRARLRWGALLHDIGKLDVPTDVLDVGAAPTAEERDALEHHAARAEALVAPLRPWLGEWVDAATQHHERIDGRGYPAGRHGDRIGLAARIVAVADAYDAMTSPRTYRRPLTPAEARAELVGGSGTQFDPMVVRAFLHVPVGRMHGAAGVLAWLARFPAGGRVLAATRGPAVPALGALGTVALVAAATLAGLAIRVTEAPDAAAAADRTTSTAEPSTTGGPGDTGTTGTTGGQPGDAGDGDGRRDGDDRGRGEGPADETAAGLPDEPGTTGTTTPDGDDPDDPSTTTTEPDDPTTTTEPPGTTTTTEPPGTTTTTVPPNAPPVAAADATSVTVLSTTSIDVLDNDRDDRGLDPSTLTITSGPGAGTASVVGGQIRYTAPLLGSSAQVGYRVCDTHGACDTAVLTIGIRLL